MGGLVRISYLFFHLRLVGRGAVDVAVVVHHRPPRHLHGDHPHPGGRDGGREHRPTLRRQGGHVAAHPADDQRVALEAAHRLAPPHHHLEGA
eukprot:93429-Prorocentrum_minimum.AAC.1